MKQQPPIVVVANIDFNLALTTDDVWTDASGYVAGINGDAEQAVLDALSEISRQDVNVGVALRGISGSGKTHMLSWLRERIYAAGGYFLAVPLLDGYDFWDTVVRGTLNSLTRPLKLGQTQLVTVLRRLSSAASAPSHIRTAIFGETPLTVDAMDDFIDRLSRYAPEVFGESLSESHGTARALALYAASDLALQDVGYSYLLSQMESQSDEFAAWGLPPAPRTAELVFEDLMQLLALTGPSVIGIDQIDTLVAVNIARTPSAKEPAPAVPPLLTEGIASLFGRTHRTLTVAACLPQTWELLCQAPDSTIRGLFRAPALLAPISGSHAREIIHTRLEAHYERLNFEPPYPTWPVAPTALEQNEWPTPRRLLRDVQDFLHKCVEHDDIRELTEFSASPVVGPPTEPTAFASEQLTHLDQLFSDLRKAAHTTTALEPAHEDQMMAELLTAGLQAWIIEQPDSNLYAVEPIRPGSKAPLHARLRRFSTTTPDSEEEIHWCFRAIATSHAIGALSRIQAAALAAGLSENNSNRTLIVLRNTPWPAGRKTDQTIAALARVGGRTHPIDDEDLRILTALHSMIRTEDPLLHDWIRIRKPTLDVRFIHTALSAPPGSLDADTPWHTKATREPVLEPDGPAIEIGHFIDSEQPAVIALEDFRRHTVIFGGSGSGRTVLIRRLIEECALQGVSAIVVDSNNDLTRLGDIWPQEPAGWNDDDPVKAATYLENTDVVVWTPQLEEGQPLRFEPLPDFAAVSNDADELAAALDAAVATLATRADVEGESSRAVQCRAVLKEALQYLARMSGGTLHQLIALLTDLPSGVSMLSKAPKLAAEMADTLAAETVSDPLFGGAGKALDPGVLLTPPPGKAARISVISFVGLPSDAQRQIFVNQLQMALFTWIKRHPAGHRPLVGLLVMDEAQTLTPSGTMTACTHSTLALASQARKYGLGLVFATQTPKGLHNRIPSNAATQFFGRLNSPAQIATAQELARAKGAIAVDISALRVGQFYLAASDAPVGKIQAPMCLSHHPLSPMTANEVIGRIQAKQ